MTENSSLTEGPDFALGVPLGDNAEGGMLTGYGQCRRTLGCRPPKLRTVGLLESL